MSSTESNPQIVSMKQIIINPHNIALRAATNPFNKMLSSFTLSKIRSGRAQGQSRAALTHKLIQSGIKSDLISELMSRPPSDTGRYDPHAIELAACIISARKKRIGPYSRNFPIELDERQKQLGKLARAGFSHEHARRVLSLESQQEAEDLLYEVTEAGEN